MLYKESYPSYVMLQERIKSANLIMKCPKLMAILQPTEKMVQKIEDSNRLDLDTELESMETERITLKRERSPSVLLSEEMSTKAFCK